VITEQAATPSTPPEPARPPHRRWRDWRTYVGGLGRILIAVGVLILAFVAYQLWGTNIQEARAQNKLEDQFEQTIGTATPPPPPVTTVATPTTPAPTVPGASTVPPPPPTTGVPPPVTQAPAERPVYADGDPVARLEIPKIGMDKIVVQGVNTADLRRGPGHYIGTPLPGEVGNAGIAGHRTTYGAPFDRLNRLQPGDEVIATSYAGRFVYRVVDTKVVPPSGTDVLDNSTDARITLTTCHPRYSTRERLIVVAVLDPAASSPPAPAPTALPQPPAGDGGDGQTVEPGTSPTTTPSATTVAPGTTVAPQVTVPVTVSDDALEAFSAGWFSDDSAWPHVALWGFALIAIALWAWAISRATRHDLIGAAVGIIPFVVVLYFWFENVARLLPPNL
jgi:sortase A